jgi:hypothetical protein
LQPSCFRRFTGGADSPDTTEAGVTKEESMDETYRMLGREREKELLAEAERLKPLTQRRRERHLPTQMKEKKMTRFTVTLVLIAIAIAVPSARAEPSYGPLDPPIAAAIEMHRHDLVPLDPAIAAAVQEHRHDLVPLDPAIATAIQLRHSKAQLQPAAVHADASGFAWNYLAIAAGVLLAAVVALGSLRVRSRQSASLGA